MSEREPTAEELEFAEQFRREVSGAYGSAPVEPAGELSTTGELNDEVEGEGEEQGTTESSTDASTESEAELVARLFRAKPADEAFIRTIHGGGDE